jgi:hypothetical protein
MYPHVIPGLQGLGLVAQEGLQMEDLKSGHNVMLMHELARRLKGSSSCPSRGSQFLVQVTQNLRQSFKAAESKARGRWKRWIRAVGDAFSMILPMDVFCILCWVL